MIAHQALASGSAPSWVVVHPTKNVAYTTDAGKNTISILDLDPASGELTLRSTVAAGAGITPDRRRLLAAKPRSPGPLLHR